MTTNSSPTELVLGAVGLLGRGAQAIDPALREHAVGHLRRSDDHPVWLAVLTCFQLTWQGAGA